MTAYFEDLTCCKDLRWTLLCRIKLSALLSILKYNSSVINHLLDSYFICNIYLVKWVTLKGNQNISLLFELYVKLLYIDIQALLYLIYLFLR